MLKVPLVVVASVAVVLVEVHLVGLVEAVGMVDVKDPSEQKISCSSWVCR